MKQLLFFLVLFTFLYGASAQNSSFQNQLAYAALKLTKDQVTYDPSYFSISYPNGDVPANKGVCTDVIIRAYRKLNIDLQKLVHEDMVKNFNEYPNNWGLTRTDSNIDHRRVPNLMTFFSRHGTSCSNSNNPSEYQPGDIVCWDLGNGLQHIGIVVNNLNGKPFIVHNIGNGQVLEDMLFQFQIIGHYRYQP